MSSTLLSLPEDSRVDALLVQAKNIQNKVLENEAIMSRKPGSVLCPVCQSGHLQSVERGKAFKVFSDIWLICDKCEAEFDKKLSKATLVKATADPYGVFGQHANQTFTIDQWRLIALKRFKDENLRYEAQLSDIKRKIADLIQDKFASGELRLLIADVGGFILKKNEVALFSTLAEVIEERKRKVTQRTTVGGGRRNYGGFSFRVARGVYYHTGSSSQASPRQTIVQSTEYTELVTADVGDFVITNQRIMFKGSRARGIAIPIGKIAAIDVDSDQNALMVITENRKPVVLKLNTSLRASVAGVDIPFDVDLDRLVDMVKQAQ
ncbi:MAG: hypothetical protein A4E65_00250 [Syntrophorhabdus sp. PtaU1.Bin153]|nr:MAG: hypothetical protein A4E65_00250 [Syntrophorhabdus sp. PtaU1.Bin153]